jgi:hypothetical protein
VPEVLPTLEWSRPYRFVLHCRQLGWFEVNASCLQEAGIPIDMVGGVSIGAFMGALWCSERDIVTMTQKAREWSQVVIFLLLFVKIMTVDIIMFKKLHLLAVLLMRCLNI